MLGGKDRGIEELLSGVSRSGRDSFCLARNSAIQMDPYGSSFSLWREVRHFAGVYFRYYYGLIKEKRD